MVPGDVGSAVCPSPSDAAQWKWLPMERVLGEEDSNGRFVPEGPMKWGLIWLSPDKQRPCEKTSCSARGYKTAAARLTIRTSGVEVEKAENVANTTDGL